MVLSMICKFEDPLVAKFHPIGLKERKKNCVEPNMLDEQAANSYLPYLDVPDDTAGYFAESDAMRPIGLLIGIPPLQTERK